MKTIISYKPLTPSLRHTVLINKSLHWRGKVKKILSWRIYNQSGRNTTGQITVRHKGNKRYRKIFRYLNYNILLIGIPSFIARIEYDPNRSAFVALHKYANDFIVIF